MGSSASRLRSNCGQSRSAPVLVAGHVLCEAAELGANLLGVSVVQVVEGSQGLRPRGAGGGYVAAGVVGVADVGQGFRFLVAEAEFGV